MSTIPAWMRLPVTAGEYLERSDPDLGRWELQEGCAVAAPLSPACSRAGGSLCAQLDSQLPAGLVVLPLVCVDLGLVGPDGPGTVRRPALVVAEVAALDGRPAVTAEQVRLVVEIVSRARPRTVRTVKAAEYADAGIPYYWIVDLDAPVSLLPLHLTDDLGYVADGEVTGDCAVDGPFPVRLRLGELSL